MTRKRETRQKVPQGSSPGTTPTVGTSHTSHVRVQVLGRTQTGGTHRQDFRTRLPQRTTLPDPRRPGPGGWVQRATTETRTSTHQDPGKEEYSLITICVGRNPDPSGLRWIEDFSKSPVSQRTTGHQPTRQGGSRVTVSSSTKVSVNKGTSVSYSWVYKRGFRTDFETGCRKGW